MLITLLALVALLAVALAAAAVSCRERFATKKSKKIDDAHKQLIRKRCAAGYTVNDVLKKWPFMSKYDRSVVSTICNAHRKSGGGGGSATVCPHGACPNKRLHSKRPCRNQKKNKCCDKQLKKCVPDDELAPQPSAPAGRGAKDAAPVDKPPPGVPADAWCVGHRVSDNKCDRWRSGTDDATPSKDYDNNGKLIKSW